MTKPNVITLNVTEREGTGKGTARAARRQGLIPGVVYGDKKAPVLFNIEENTIMLLTKKKGFWTTQFEINTGKEKIKTICQDVQLHPVSDRPLHVDFLRISKGAKMTIEVPVEFINEDKCPGLKMGGVLNVVSRDLEVVCSADNMPSSIIVDLEGKELNEAVYSGDVKLPAGVEFANTDEEGFTIASINPVVEIKEEEIVSPADVPTDADAKAEAKSDKE